MDWQKEGGQRQGDQGDALRESEEQKAERMVKAMLEKVGWTEAALRALGKGDPKKARMAARLRQETTRRWAWIARRLVLMRGAGWGIARKVRVQYPGAEYHLTRLLYRHGRSGR